jgi:hypothetical protein
VAVAVVAILTFFLPGCGSESSPADDRKPPFEEIPMGFIVPGKRQPPTEPADKADLAPDEEVIGVSVGGASRAYVCAALSTLGGHVINDAIADTPVTVVFCDRNRCARAFTMPDRTAPLEIDLGGWTGSQLLLHVNGRLFPLDAADIPFDEVQVEKTTWREWQQAHPGGDVFTGRARSGSGTTGGQ